MPDFLKERAPDQVKGIDELAKFIRPPFVKIVQGASDKDLKEEYPEKTVLLVPGNDVVAEPGQKLLFTPILHYQEFLCVNPLELRGQVPMVHDRSFDPASDIARRAFNPDLRSEPMVQDNGEPWLVKGKQIYRSYQDTRVFLIVIHEPVKPGRICALTFSRAELRTAERLSSLISAKQRDIFCGVYEAEVGIHKNPDFSWYGFDIDNAGFVADLAQFKEYEHMHDLLSKALADRRLIVDPVEGGGQKREEAPAEQDPTVKDGDAF